MAAKKTRGRQKIEMKKIENENDRMIAFSKRRSGIYKKASELATLTGAEIGIVVFSPSGKPFSFGHPSLEAVANRFLGLNQEHPNDNTHLLVEAHRRVRISELNQQHNELLRQLDEENAREKILKQNRKGKETQPHWWETPVNEINHQELLQMDTAVDDLHKTFLAKLNEKTAAASSSMAPPIKSDEATPPND
ncbi:agamous-like MADS-box protein AGL61 [Citrus sinensis]|uniref:agamous-like MADS-box protein AGL61 n=1 Tax=Citrus sinensis TaxID=2711 RepID=UPI0022773EF6|nr:agamous-like MADS-box protein AGL61 [Citrus sinensis]